LQGWGEEGWEKVVNAQGRENVAKLSSCPYPDDLMYSIIIAASETLGTNINSMLEQYGRHFLRHLFEQGYSDMLRCLGASLPDFLGSLNDMHVHFSLSYKHMAVPVFSVRNATSTSLELVYEASRPGVWPIVAGMLKEIALVLFKHEITVELIEEFKDPDICRGSANGALLRYPSTPHSPAQNERYVSKEVLKISYPYDPVFFKRTGSETGSQRLRRVDSDILKAGGHFNLPYETINEICPFHLLIVSDDDRPKIVQLGRSYTTLYPSLKVNSSFDEKFRLVSPQFPFSSFSNLERISGGPLVLSMTGPDASTVELKGIMVFTSIPQANGCPVPRDAILFQGGPRISSFSDMESGGLTLSDVPSHDLTRDFLLLSEQRKVEAELLQRFEQLSSELQMANKMLAESQAKLAEESRRSEALLYRMLPPFAAEKLKHGQSVVAEDYPSVSILFTDIVGFTEISARSTPRQVCLMLDNLYLTFDSILKARYPELFKVETIGDAYMVVANLSRQCIDHADQIIGFGLELQEATKSMVASDGSPLRIRLGINSGPIVGGIIGSEMPHFCLFGESQMITTPT
jgi:guanylate cyclase soluble subunit beta